MSSLILQSRIQRVVVHARGAIVTRSVTLAESLPNETCELVVPDITPLAEPATFRALAKGARQVVSVIPRFVVPDGPAKVGSATERVQTAEATRVTLNEEKAHVTGRRNQLAGIQFNLGLDRRFEKTNARTRIEDALAMTRLVHDELAELDARLVKLDAAINQAEKALEAARIAEAQARSAERTGTSRPTLSCHVRLAAGQTPLEALEIEYIVLAARFWPTYKAWLTKGATQVRLELDALVVQDTGEDWTQVEMALSTADLVRDARLPELPSLRFGRATPPKKRGYRPPPAGLEGMFEAYDQAMAKMPSTVTVEALRSAPPAVSAPMAAPRGGPPGGSSSGEAKTMVGGYAMSPAMDEGGAYVRLAVPEESTERAKGEARMQTRAGFAPPPQSRSASFQGAPAVRPAPAAPMKKLAAPPPASGGFGGGPSFDRMLADEEEAEEVEEIEEGAREFKDSGGNEPDDAWLDFDALTLPGPDKPRRGKLTRAPDESVRAEALRAQQQVARLPDPARTKDPYVYRGLFDYCYEAVGRGDVPSNGRPQRVHVLAAEGPAKPRFRTVPKESLDVFRETLIENPLGAPLCAGPLDVFLDGALLTTTEIAAVDRGGVVAVGLGVEDRLRVARNARVEESTVGLLGGSTHLDHYITVDITSSLGMPITLELLERIPVTDDKDVSVKVIATDPESEAYDQSDLGSPVRGGRRFRLDVAAGGKTRVSYAYRIKLPAKNEIVGGNRRE